MKQLLLHVPGRRPADWHDNLTDSQCAVFFRDVRNGAELDPDGQVVLRHQPLSCLVFDSLQEAKDFCREKVGQFEHLRCEIFDWRGCAVPPMCRFVNQRYAGTLPNRRSAVRMIVSGCLLILISPLLVWWDWHYYRGGMVIPTFLGINCVFLGGRLFYLAHCIFKSISRSEQENVRL